MSFHFNRPSYVFTSESVSEGHPDKICDQISDALLDSYLARNPTCRAAVETLATTNKIVIAGETRDTQHSVEEERAIITDLVRDIGYEQEGFDWRKLDIENCPASPVRRDRAGGGCIGQ